ncbi:hypothetical protein LguiB_017357 [Lonicera macranthoides]
MKSKRERRVLPSISELKLLNGTFYLNYRTPDIWYILSQFFGYLFFPPFTLMQ